MLYRREEREIGRKTIKAETHTTIEKFGKAKKKKERKKDGAGT